MTEPPATTPDKKPAPWRGRRRSHDVKGKCMTVRVTVKDRSKIADAAGKAGLSVGEFVRTATLGRKLPRAVKPPLEAARAHITSLWQQSDTGAAFAKGLEASGWTLARGDRRDFVVIDPKGGVHSLGRRIEGAKVKEVRARLVDLDISTLPTVAEARALQRARQRAPVRQEAARPQPPASGQRPAPRPAPVVTSSLRRALATRLAGSRAARRPALPIPRSLAPAPVRITGRPAQAAGGLFTAASTGSRGGGHA